MKEATGELNMTLVTIIAIAAILGFVTFLLPGILDTIGSSWKDTQNTKCWTDESGVTHCEPTKKD